MSVPHLLWLDDARQAPPGWLWARDARTALSVLATVPVEYASLDCDLVDQHEDGLWLVRRMAKYRLWPRCKPGVHSSNWERGAEMLRVIRKCGPYDEYATWRGYPPPQGGKRG